VERGGVNEFRLSKENLIGPGFYKIPAVIIKEQRFSLSDDKGSKYPKTDCQTFTHSIVLEQRNY